METHTITIRNVKDFESRCELATSLNMLFSVLATGTVSLRFDLSGMRHWDASFLAVSALLGVRLASEGVEVQEIVQSATDPMPGTELDASFQVVDGVPVIISSLYCGPDSTKLVSRFKLAEHDVIDKIVRNFEQYFGGISDIYNKLESSLAELMDNVFAHSSSSEGGALAALYNESNRKFQFSICDFGVSIPGHLKSRVAAYSDKSDAFVLSEAFVLGVSGNKETRFGSGLFTVKEYTSAFGGSIEAFSGEAVYLFSNQVSTSEISHVRFPGTLITVGWNVR